MKTPHREAITAMKEALAQPSDSVEKPINFELAYGEIYKDQRAALAKALAQPEQEPLETESDFDPVYDFVECVMGSGDEYAQGLSDRDMGDN